MVPTIFQTDLQSKTGFQHSQTQLDIFSCNGICRYTYSLAQLFPCWNTKPSTEKLCFAATFTSMSVVVCAEMCPSPYHPGFTKAIACADTIYRSWFFSRISSKHALAVSVLTLMLFGGSLFYFNQEVDYSQFTIIVRVVVNGIHICFPNLIMTMETRWAAYKSIIVFKNLHLTTKLWLVFSEKMTTRQERASVNAVSGQGRSNAAGLVLMVWSVDLLLLTAYILFRKAIALVRFAWPYTLCFKGQVLGHCSRDAAPIFRPSHRRYYHWQVMLQIRLCFSSSSML